MVRTDFVFTGKMKDLLVRQGVRRRMRERVGEFVVIVKKTRGRFL